MPAVTVLGLPFDHNSSFARGAAQAPPRLRAAFRSESSNMFSERGLDVGGIGDRGDVDRWDDIVAAVLEIDGCPLCLGGDHSVTYPVLQAIRRRHAKLTILHLDAHPDLYPELDGNPLSNACPFARIMEESLCDRLVQVGIRTLNDVQRAQVARFGVEVIEMREMGKLITFEGPLYVSIDLDALDPAFAPGVSHPEPGGLSTRQLIDLLSAIDAPVVGADIVEYNPRRDINGATAMVGARLMKELAALMLR